jgi:hypothetical protein
MHVGQCMYGSVAICACLARLKQLHGMFDAKNGCNGVLWAPQLRHCKTIQHVTVWCGQITRLYPMPWIQYVASNKDVHHGEKNMQFLSIPSAVFRFLHSSCRFCSAEAWLRCTTPVQDESLQQHDYRDSCIDSSQDNNFKIYFQNFKNILRHLKTYITTGSQTGLKYSRV